MPAKNPPTQAIQIGGMAPSYNDMGCTQPVQILI
jgi:hypothetical protein